MKRYNFVDGLLEQEAQKYSIADKQLSLAACRQLRFPPCFFADSLILCPTVGWLNRIASDVNLEDKTDGRN